MSYQPPAKIRVRWGRVALFYGLAFGWVCLVSAALFLAGSRNLSGAAGPSALTTLLAVLYMPAPLVAALIVERLDRRPALLRTAFTGLWRKLPRVVAAVAAIVAVLLLGMVGLNWLVGNLIGVDAAGTVLVSQQDLVAGALTLVPAQNADQVAALSAAMPSLWGLLAVAFVGAMVAGFTINGVLAFGEEYGWRGWLADELRPVGAFWANVITGVLWGLWHAPLIVMGFNYGDYGRLGPFFMVAWCVPMSFLLWRLREVTDSLVAPAALHGAFNGFASVFLLVLAGANPLIAAPVGLIGTVTLTLVAAAFWGITRSRSPRAA
ncbi:MAG: CPBP family intramembrane glutamic endopeptidase [Propionicimonas sp.]